MVQKPLIDPTIDALLRRSETARRRLAYDIGELKHRVDVPARLKESLQLNPSRWLGGSLVAGLVSSFMLRRRKPRTVPLEKKVQRAGLTGLALTAGSALVRPLLTSLVKGYLQRTLASRLPPSSSRR